MSLPSRLSISLLLLTPACIVTGPDDAADTDAEAEASSGDAPGSTSAATDEGEDSTDPDSSGSTTADAPEVIDCGSLDEDVLSDRTIEAGCVVQVPHVVRVGAQAILTLEPGVQLEFGPGAGLEVGVDCSDEDCTGSLRAQGTAEAPVVFTSNSPVPGAGDWQGVHFGALTMNGTRIESARFEYAGSDGSGAVRFVAGDPIPFSRVAIVGTEFSDNAAGGLTVDLGYNFDEASGPFFAELADNTFSDGPYSVRLDPAAVDSIGGGNSFATPIQIEVYYEGIRREATWSDHGVPYVLLSSLTVASQRGPASLTLEPGVQMLFSRGTHLAIGDLFAPGALHATDVLFDSAAANPLPGDWDGIWLDSDISPSSIDGCTIAHAFGAGPGESNGVITMQQGYTEDILPVVSITNTVFEDNGGLLDIFAEIGPGGPLSCSKYTGNEAGNTFDLVPCL
jgi:hypothetical protein